MYKSSVDIYVFLMRKVKELSRSQGDRFEIDGYRHKGTKVSMPYDFMTKKCQGF